MSEINRDSKEWKADNLRGLIAINICRVETDNSEVMRLVDSLVELVKGAKQISLDTYYCDRKTKAECNSCHGSGHYWYDHGRVICKCREK